MTISCGCAMYNNSIETIEQFIKRADQALYQAKERGRDQVGGY